MMKNQKGITLIALVITIIVLLILAGVSIAMLTGKNGILTQTNKAKYTQIEGQVKEEINLAVQSAKMFAEQKAVSSPSGWLASSTANIGTADDAADDQTIIGQMRADLTTGKGYKTITPGTGKVTITYATANYSSATNYADAKIVAEIGISNNTFTVNSIKAYRDTDHASTGENI